MKLCLKLVASISANCVDPEWEFLDGVVDEGYGICLVVTGVYFECSDTRGVINGRVLKSANSMTVGPFEA
jgi:hypothetical protein